MPDKVLCVEDNPQNMRLVRKILTGAGYQVLEANDGLSALQVIEKQSPDLVLIDINLPDIDGLEVTARVKANPILASIPIIALTANAMHGDRERCLNAGCSGYVPKPITKRDLLTTVGAFVKTGS